LKVFVTGGAGFIGSITSHLLSRTGHEVVIYDDLSTGHKDSIPKNAAFIQGNILDTEELFEAMSGCDAVLHFAGRAIVSESFEKEEAYFNVNHVGSKNVFDSATRNNIQKIVVSSSCAVYGNKYFTAISEQFHELPMNPYGLSKLKMDQALSRTIKENSHIGAISLRFFNVAGALEVDGKWIGENHVLETHVIPNLISARPESPFRLYGNDYATPDGTCIRDYVHVVDIAEAHIAALDKIPKGEHKVINLGSNTGYSLGELINLTNSILGYEIPVLLQERRKGDPDFLVAQNSKAFSELEWKPKMSLTKIIEDHLSYINAFNN
jgi:UDP-glucose 4-epimerase